MNFLRTISVALVLVSWLGRTEAQSLDLTVQPGAKGRDVVDAVVRIIDRSGIFPEDSGFLRRWAYVQTRFGEDLATYRNGYYGGIWQVDQDDFEATKNTQANPKLAELHRALQNLFIDWPSVTWQDLLKPLYSGLAASLFLTTLPATIPGTLQEQGQFWKDYCYETGQPEKFVEDVKALESADVCPGRMDLCIVLDSSGSIGAPNYQKAKDFVAHFINTFSLDSVRVGFIVFSTDVYTVFEVDNTLTMDEMMATVQQVPYYSLDTNTNGAILKAVELLTKSDRMDGSPRVMTVFTDGKSNNGVTSSVQEAKLREIQSFSVGIGSNTNQAELLQIAYGDPSHVFSLTSFDALADFFYRLNMEACTVPQRPAVNQFITDQLKRNERRYYAYDVPPEGLTVKLDTDNGETRGYYSYTEKTPSSAIYDGQFDRQAFVPARPATYRQRRSANDTMTTGQPVYIAVEGLQDNNNYTIAGIKGDVRTGSASSLQMTLWVIASALNCLILTSL